jgi:hypothetical protein
MEHLGLNVAKLPILDGIVWQASCSQLSRSEPEPAQGWWRQKPRDGVLLVASVGFDGDLMGFHRDLMGFHSDIIWYNGKSLGSSGDESRSK